jgi:hypothetical protein
MKPEIDQALRSLSARILMDIAPNVAVDYAKASLEVTAVLMLVAAEEYDRAADIRAEENRAMRGLFRDAAPDVPETDLRGRLESAAAGEDSSLRVSALNAANDGLRSLLIELHEYVEVRSESWASRINHAIWKELEASAARRAIPFFPA